MTDTMHALCFGLRSIEGVCTMYTPKRATLAVKKVRCRAIVRACEPRGRTFGVDENLPGAANVTLLDQLAPRPGGPGTLDP